MNSYEKIYELAAGNFGLITAAQANELGASTREMSRWVKMGRLEKPCRGLFRVSLFPSSPFDVFATAVESVGAEAYLYGESVLAILNLVPTNPTWINVATPMRKRKSLMDGVRVFPVKGNFSPVSYDGVRSQRVADAIVDCRNIIRRDRLERALKTAVKQGYIRKDEVSSIKKGLQKP